MRAAPDATASTATGGSASAAAPPVRGGWRAAKRGTTLGESKPSLAAPSAQSVPAAVHSPPAQQTIISSPPAVAALAREAPQSSHPARKLRLSRLTARDLGESPSRSRSRSPSIQERIQRRRKLHAEH